MISNFEVELNCPYCLDELVAALRHEPTVTDVHTSIAAGCVTVTHDTDESRLSGVIADIGRRISVAENSEIVQGELHAVSRHGCRAHR